MYGTNDRRLPSLGISTVTTPCIPRGVAYGNDVTSVFRGIEAMAAEYRSIVDLTGSAAEDGFGVLKYMPASSAPSSWRVLGTFDQPLGFPE